MAARGKVTCRRATLNDYEAVMDINRNVYSGFDYLPYEYKQFTKSPNRIGFVGELDGKVVNIPIT